MSYTDQIYLRQYIYFEFKANNFDSRNNYKTSLRSISRWLVAVYGHTYGVSRALQACADDIDNVVIVAFPEFHGTATETVGGLCNG